MIVVKRPGLSGVFGQTLALLSDLRQEDRRVSVAA